MGTGESQAWSVVPETETDVPYAIEFKPGANKGLSALPKPDQHRIAAKINALALNPRPPGVTKLTGEQDLYRIRSGDYRIIYTIQDKRLIVLVLRIAHRREVYR